MRTWADCCVLFCERCVVGARPVPTKHKVACEREGTGGAQLPLPPRVIARACFSILKNRALTHTTHNRSFSPVPSEPVSAPALLSSTQPRDRPCQTRCVPSATSPATVLPRIVVLRQRGVEPRHLPAAAGTLTQPTTPNVVVVGRSGAQTRTPTRRRTP